MSQKNKKFFILSLALILLIGPVCYANLQIDYFGSNAPTNETKLPGYIAYLFQTSIIICVIIVLVSLISGGYQYFTARGSSSKIKQSKDQIFAAFLGLIMLLSSWFILNIINPGLTQLSIPLADLPEAEEYSPKERPNESAYLVIPFGQYLENNFYGLEAMQKIAEQANDVNITSKSFDKIYSLLENLAESIKNCRCNDCQCSGGCPCSGSCPNAICEKEKIDEIASNIEEETKYLSQELSKLQGNVAIFETVKKMGTLMSLAENKNVDSYYTFLGGKNLLEGSKTKLTEDCDPFNEWDYYWQKNKADPITFYLNKSANKRLINDIISGNLNLDEITVKNISTKDASSDDSLNFENEGWMPIGETAQEIVETTEESNKAINQMVESANKLISIASSFISVANTCQSSENCQHDCKENYDSDGNCYCSGSTCSPEYLCDISSLEKLLSEANRIVSEFSSGKDNFINILSANRIPPDYLKDLYGTDFTKLPKSHVYTDYNEFYQNFNQLISPILAEMGQEITLPVAKGKAIPFIEFVKRQSDYSRIGFLNCQTAVGAEEDMENIADGIIAYKYPYRVDFILANQINILIKENESNLNYYCAGAKEIEPQ